MTTGVIPQSPTTERVPPSRSMQSFSRPQERTTQQLMSNRLSLSPLDSFYQQVSTISNQSTNSSSSSPSSSV